MIGILTKTAIERRSLRSLIARSLDRVPDRILAPVILVVGVALFVGSVMFVQKRTGTEIEEPESFEHHPYR